MSVVIFENGTEVYQPCITSLRLLKDEHKCWYIQDLEQHSFLRFITWSEEKVWMCPALPYCALSFFHEELQYWRRVVRVAERIYVELFTLFHSMEATANESSWKTYFRISTLLIFESATLSSHQTVCLQFRRRTDSCIMHVENFWDVVQN